MSDPNSDLPRVLPWMFLVVMVLFPCCAKEPESPADAKPLANGDAAVENRDEPTEDALPEPALAGAVTIAVDRKLPTDLFICVYPTQSPPSSLYRLQDASGVEWVPVESDGSFHVAELTPGSYSILVSDGRFPLSPVMDVVVPSVEARECRLVVESECGYDIHVTDSTGKPAPDVEVSVLRTAGAVAYIGRTDEKGTFAIEDALIGDYLCNLKAPGAHLPKHKGMIGLRVGPRGASYYQLGEADYR